MTREQQRTFCEALGIRWEQVRVERVSHPEKRAHLIFKVSHPWFGEGTDQLEDRAWQKFMDAAERKGALPSRCQALKKDGQPCGNSCQAGESFCGPHMPKGAGPLQVNPAEEGALCAAATASGQPCRNKPQRGERYCGPHLAKIEK
jgi:hypothetical protein